MATTKGSGGVVKLAATGGSATAVGEVRNFSIEQTADTLETTVMGATARTYVGSLKNATVSMSVYWDDGDAVQLLVDAADSLDFQIHPTGTGSGEKFYSGSAVVTSNTISAAFDGLIEGEFAFQVSGAVTEGTN